MSESKYSQNDALDGKSLSELLAAVLRDIKMSGFFHITLNPNRQSWLALLERVAIHLPKYIYKYLSNQCVIGFLRTDNRIQSKTL